MKGLIFFLYIVTCYGDNIFSARVKDSNDNFSPRARNFSIEILHNTQSETDGHVVISPFGIWTLLTGLALGANGKSQSQLTRALVLPRNKNKILKGYKNLTKSVLEPRTQKVKLENKNFVFLDKDFDISRDFENTLKSDFGAEVRNLDFKNSTAAAQVANGFIKESGVTMSDVLRAEDFNVKGMLLTNVISFEAPWSFPFNTSDTKPEDFYNEHGEKIGKVNMMYQLGEFSVTDVPSLQAYALEMPYGSEGDDKFSMLIILPHPKINVNEVYKRFTTATLGDICEKLQKDIAEFGINELYVKLPRFKISTNIILNGPLNRMGVFDIFNPYEANFNKITKENIYISSIVHKADIEVTEYGTKATAHSVAVLNTKIFPKELIFDRPFIYFVLEKPTTTVIFNGIYSKPSQF
ncbi:unnamed protein product, partial [Brenthis ino]